MPGESSSFWDYEIGVDIAEVVRIRSAVRRWGDRFLNKHFTAGEISYCQAKARPAESLAPTRAADDRGPVRMPIASGARPELLRNRT